MISIVLCFITKQGDIKLFDVKHYISGSWFEELLDVSYFKTVYLLPNGTVIKWLNSQDIVPR